jgi:EmrB/QacA subfamily drug resistance transporter
MAHACYCGQGGGVPPRHVNPWLVLSLVCLAQFMVILDATIVNVALPSIQTDLNMSEGSLQWVVNSYTLTFGGFLLLGGRAGDLIGRKRVFLTGVVVFVVASFLNGIAGSSTLLILARGLQGFGAALVAPAALSILTTTFAEGRDRTRALGVWAAIATGGAAVGLLLGGILVEFLSWPWIFFVNVPVGIATFLASLKYVPESRADAEHRTFDVPGAVTVTAGLIALVYGIVNVQKVGWTSGTTIVWGTIALVLLSAFVLIEQRQRAPLVRLGIFAVRTVRAANVTMLLVASGLFAMFFFNTLYVQRVLGFSPLQAGLAFLPFTAGIGIGAGLSQPGVKKLGIRTTSIVGMTLASIGMLLLLTTDANGTYLSDLLPGLLVISIGMGLTFVPVTLLATSGVEHADAGLASGLFNTSQQVGGALGLAILSTLSVNRTDNALSGLTGAPTQAQQNDALVTGFHAAFAGSAVLLATGIVVMATLLKRSDVEQVDVDRAMTEMAA